MGMAGREKKTKHKEENEKKKKSTRKSMKTDQARRQMTTKEKGNKSFPSKVER